MLVGRAARLVLLSAVLCASLLLAGCALTAQRYDLAKPINSEDWLLVWEDSAQVTTGFLQSPDMRVHVGEPLFGYPALLGDYVEVLTIGEHGGNTISSWIDDTAPAMYFLPLWGDSEVWASAPDQCSQQIAAMFVWRESHNTLLAHRFDEQFEAYLAARWQLEHFLDAGEYEAAQPDDHEILWSLLGGIALVRAESGTYGWFFSDYYADEYLMQFHDFEELSSQVMTETELIELFQLMSKQIADPQDQ